MDISWKTGIGRNYGQHNNPKNYTQAPHKKDNLKKQRGVGSGGRKTRYKQPPTATNDESFLPSPSRAQRGAQGRARRTRGGVGPTTAGRRLIGGPRCARQRGRVSRGRGTSPRDTRRPGRGRQAEALGAYPSCLAQRGAPTQTGGGQSAGRRGVRGDGGAKRRSRRAPPADRGPSPPRAARPTAATRAEPFAAEERDGPNYGWSGWAKRARGTQGPRGPVARFGRWFPRARAGIKAGRGGGSGAGGRRRVAVVVVVVAAVGPPTHRSRRAPPPPPPTRHENGGGGPTPQPITAPGHAPYRRAQIWPHCRPAACPQDEYCRPHGTSPGARCEGESPKAPG